MALQFHKMHIRPRLQNSETLKIKLDFRGGDGQSPSDAVVESRRYPIVTASCPYSNTRCCSGDCCSCHCYGDTQKRAIAHHSRDRQRIVSSSPVTSFRSTFDQKDILEGEDNFLKS